MSKHEQAFMALAATQAASSGGTIGDGTFKRLVLEYLKGVIQEARDAAKAALDTEEERDAIKDVVLRAADIYVAPRFTLGWPFVRKAADVFLDEAMDHLPGML